MSIQRRRRLTCALALGLGGVSCGLDSPGDDPPDDAIFFPMGMALDPARERAGGATCVSDTDCGPVSDGWTCNLGTCRQRSPLLYVTAANSDLRYNGGALQAYNLEGFFSALEDRKNVAEAGAEVSLAKPCRAVSTRPQVAECLESTFARVLTPAHVGNFGTDLEGWYDEVNDRRLLIMPVRGDPSVVWFELEGPASSGQMECGQGTSTHQDPARCGDSHRLRYLRDDPSLDRLSIEPYELTISPVPGRDLAYLTHTLASSITLIDLRGISGDPAAAESPVIIDRTTAFASPSAVSGGYGVAERPCSEAEAPGLTVECEDDGGSLSCISCARPLIYGAFRFARALSEMIAFEIPEASLSPYQSCVEPGDIGVSGGVVCEPQVTLLNQFSPGGLSGAGGGTIPRLGAVGFNTTGDEMYVVQSTPGALLRLDMSVKENGDLERTPTGAVEVCARPSELTLYEDGVNSFALVSCYSVGQVYIIDLDAFQVVSVTQVGTGPHRMTADLAREVVYVGNTLDATVSVIDMGDARDTRFAEIGRLGIQTPYSG